MSVSIYYKAEPKSTLSQTMIDRLDAIASRYAVDAEIEEYLHSGNGRN